MGIIPTRTWAEAKPRYGKGGGKSHWIEMKAMGVKPMDRRGGSRAPGISYRERQGAIGRDRYSVGRDAQMDSDRGWHECHKWIQKRGAEAR